MDERNRGEAAAAVTIQRSYRDLHHSKRKESRKSLIQQPSGADHDGRAHALWFKSKITLVQARMRGFLKRNCLYNGEAAMSAHLVVMEESDEQAEAAERERLAGEDDFKSLDQLINRADHRDYLNEVSASRNSLIKRIDELERNRYYLAAAQQRKVQSEIKKLRSQLADINKEYNLIKRHANSKSVCASMPRPSPADATKLRKTKSADASVGRPSMMSFLQSCTSMNRDVSDSVAPRVKLQLQIGAIPASDRLLLRHVQLLTTKDANEETIVRVQLNRPESVIADDAGRSKVSVSVCVVGDSTPAVTADGAVSNRSRASDIVVAKQSPQGYEAALRSALLQTEMWKMDSSTSIRRASTLRRDIERCQLQSKLASRAMARLARVYPDDQVVKQGKDKKAEAAKDKKAEADQLRLKQLEKYRDMLDAAQLLMMDEAKEVRRVALRRALAAKRAREAREVRTSTAAVDIQKFARGRIARRTTEKLKMKRQESRRKLIAQQQSALMQQQWGMLTTVLSGSVKASKAAKSAVLIQRLMRERAWQREQVSKADIALAAAMEKTAMVYSFLSPIRFAAQRARLMERERAYQEQVDSNRASRVASSAYTKRPLHLIETNEEWEERKAAVAAHAHRAAVEAQNSMMCPSSQEHGMATADGAGSRRQTPHPPLHARRPFTAPEGNVASRPTTVLSDVTVAATQRAGPRTLKLSARPPLRPKPGHSRGTRTQEPSHTNAWGKMTAIARHEQAWVQTPSARSMIDAVAAQLLKPTLDKMAAHAVGSGAHAAATLSRVRRACMEPPSEDPVRELITDDFLETQVFTNPRMLPDPVSTNARVALLWMDSTMAFAKIKAENASLAKWRASRRAWKRSSALRRTVLVDEEARTHRLMHLRAKDINALKRRMEQWQKEDDAALKLQQGWKNLATRREISHQQEIALRLRGIHRSSPPQNPSSPNSSVTVTLHEVDSPCMVASPTSKATLPTVKVPHVRGDVPYEDGITSVCDTSVELSSVCHDIEASLELCLTGLRQKFMQSPWQQQSLKCIGGSSQMHGTTSQMPLELA